MKRLARIVIAALSVLVAAALVVVWARTNTDDLVIGAAESGTYREIRAARDGWSFMTAAAWGKDAPRKSAWVSNAPVFDSDALALPDGETFSTTNSTRDRIWPVTHVSGRGGTRFSTIIVTGSRIVLSNVGNSPTTAPIAKAGRQPTTRAGAVVSGTMQFTFPSTAPTVIPPNVSAPSLNRSSVKITKDKDDPLGLQNMTLTLTPPSPPGGSGNAPVPPQTLRISGGTLAWAPTYPFDRYVVPHWVLMVVALLPAAVILLLVVRRSRLKRWRKRTGLCVACGYDLRGGSDVCPECGTGAAPTVMPASV